MKALAIGMAIAVTGALLASEASAQRFGDFYYTTQQQVDIRGQKRMCNMMGFDFARYDPRQSRVVNVELSRDRQCQGERAMLNGACCQVFYQNPGQQVRPSASQQLPPPGQPPHPLPGQVPPPGAPTR